MTNEETQTELCRSTKKPDEAQRTALSYEWGDKFAKSYKVNGRGLTPAPAGAPHKKTDPISSIRGGIRRPFQRGARGLFRPVSRLITFQSVWHVIPDAFIAREQDTTKELAEVSEPQTIAGLA